MKVEMNDLKFERWIFNKAEFIFDIISRFFLKTGVLEVGIRELIFEN